MKGKSIEIFRQWIEGQPKRLYPYIKARCKEALGWNDDIFRNKTTRTAITTAEQRLINIIFNEQIFTLDETKVTNLKSLANHE